MAKLPLRLLGLVLLTIVIAVASCQALFYGLGASLQGPQVGTLDR